MNKFKAFFVAFVAFLLIDQPQPTSAQCTTKTCIDVYVEGDKIVIDGKRAGATAKPGVTKSSVVRSSAPIPKQTKKPESKPTFKPSIKPSIKPTVRSSTRPRASTPSLADKILQSLPTLQVAYQPEGKVLQRVPVIFFTDLPSQFNKDFKILGVPVRINVKPRSLWNFGDGTTLLTSKPGRPYPATDITHSYSVPGTYLVSVATIWSGSFTVAGVTQEIPGAIRQISAVEVKVVGASTKFVGK
ncbi:MAG: hypothetical protein FGM48_03355 [Candidatus Nanopelagicaceae bacterium]|nr:hypothetical protein [Candidatus Nanopelagicaceae bacterium]